MANPKQEQPEQAEAKTAEQPEQAGKASRGEEVPAWQKPDYNGPMTGEIAAFRNQRYEVKGDKVVCRDGFEIDAKTGCAVHAKGK